MSPPTSQVRTPNAYTSLADVAPVSDSREHRGSTSSGAAPWKNLSTSAPDMVDGMEATPRPARYARPSALIRILV